jgi:hypothetical protein
MMEVLSDAAITVNNESIAVVPGSVVFDEGLPEYDVKAASTGGGGTEAVFSQDITTGFGSVRFKLHTTPDNIEAARVWKANKATNVVGIAGKAGDGTRLTRTCSHAAILGKYSVSLEPDGEIEIDFAGDTLV